MVRNASDYMSQCLCFVLDRVSAEPGAEKFEYQKLSKPAVSHLLVSRHSDGSIGGAESRLKHR